MERTPRATSDPRRGAPSPGPELRLSRATHDRAAHLRLDAAALEAAWNDPRARVLSVHDSAGLLLADGTDLAYLTPHQVDAGLMRLFLGLGPDGRPYFAVDRELEADDNTRVTPLREVSSRLTADASGLFVHAVGIANWHARNGFCPNCGHRTEVLAAGHVRQCPNCKAQQFPRSDPAVIMLVIDDDDRALLGRAPAWPEGRFSTLAGFVEPGESLEQAVTREVFEEVGVVVDRVTYQASQPWPFPSSLMVGFHAHAAETEIKIDADEIVEARWLSRAELLEGGRRGEILMPGPVSIARWLIEQWFGEPLPRDNHWGGSAR